MFYHYCRESPMIFSAGYFWHFQKCNLWPKGCSFLYFYHFLWCFGAVIILLTSLSTFILSRYQCVPLLFCTKNGCKMSIMFWQRLIVTFQILMYENSHIVVYGYIEAWTYHPMLNISVMPQRRLTMERISDFFQTEAICQSVNISGTIWRRWWLGNYTIAR